MNRFEYNKANVRKHGDAGIGLVEDLQELNPNCIDFLVNSHNVHHLLVYDLQVVVGWVHLYHHFLCGVLLPVVIPSHHLRHIDSGSLVLEDARALLHPQRAHLHRRYEWLHYFPFLEGYPLSWQHLRQFSRPGSC